MDISFNTFCDNLDKKCIHSFGMAWSDMPDLVLVRDLFDDGLSVDEVYEICVDEWAADNPFFAEVMGY